MAYIWNWLNSLLEPRAKPRFGWPEALLLAGYSLILFWTIPHHASWFDEAQAWLIVRDSTLRNLLFHRLHYEGAPAVWYLLLLAEFRLGFSFLGMRLIAGVIAVAGAFVWLRFNPLPRILSLSVPFSFFFLYQYAVIARSYVMVPLFAFSLMALRLNRNSSPWFFAIVAGMMANCSAHMAALSVGMVLWYGWDRRSLPNFRRLLAPALAFVGCLALATMTAWPTADLNFARENPTIQFLSHRTGPASPEPTGQVGAIPASSAVRRSPATRLFIRLITALTASISTINVLTIPFLFLLGLCLHKQRSWISVLPAFMVVLFFVGVDGASHHTGMVWIGLLCCLWELTAQTARVEQWGQLRPALLAVTALVVALQIEWTIHAVGNDLSGAYTGYRETAEYLRHLPPGTQIASFDLSSVTVNVEFSHSVYFNATTDYWPFSKTLDPSLNFDRTMAQHPDAVVAEEQDYVSYIQNQWVAFKTPGPTDDDRAIAERLRGHGYRETHRFCGNHVFRDATEFADCGVIYEPNDGTLRIP